MDKTGEFVQEKNVHSNPLKGQEHLCSFTALGCYLSIYSEQLEGTEKLFVCPGSQFCTTAQSFSLQIREIAKGILTQSGTISAYLTSTSMDSGRVVALMLPLPQSALQFYAECM